MAFFQSVVRWVEEADLVEPKYTTNSRERDEWLRAFWKREPNLAGVLSSVTSLDKNRGWQIIGGRNMVNTYSAVLRNAEPTNFNERGVPTAGAGWRRYFQRQSLSYYTADIGAVTELGFDSANGPLRALYHVDPVRCQLSGKIKTPLTYYPASGDQQAWKSQYYMRAVSMESTAEDMLGLGFCAVSRCLTLAKMMVAVYQHDLEALRALMPKGMLLMQGLTEGDWEDAMESRSEELKALERKYYAGLQVFFGDESLDAKLVALSNLPEGFELDVVVDLLINGYALAFGYDAREFWPVSGGSLGTGRETEVQAIKASGKGGLDFVLGYQDNLQRELPKTIEFEFEQRNEQGEKVEAEVADAWASAINEMAAPSGAGLLPTLSNEEKRQLLAEKGLIPEEWTAVEEETVVTDTDDADSQEAERWLDSPRIRAALALQPDEPIVGYRWPECKTRMIYDPNAVRPSHFDFIGATARGMMMKRTIAQVTREYRDRLENLVFNAWNRIDNNLSTPAQMKAALRTEHKRLIRELAPDAYIEGLREGGIVPPEMDADDKQAVAEWTSGQLPYVNGFAGAVVDAEDEDARARILDRVGSWTQSLETLGREGVGSAKRNVMVTWELGKTEKHCKTCKWLDGQRHRAKWFISKGYIPQQNGSATLECGGYKCDCEGKDDNGKRVL